MSIPPPITPTPSPRPHWVTLVLGAMAVLLLWGGFRLYGTISEIGPAAFWHHLTGQGTHTGANAIQLKPQPVYQVKKKQTLLGAHVTRIISRQQPEEFLVIQGLPAGMIDTVYGKPVDLAWANQMANQLLKLRETDEAAAPVSVDIQSVRTVDHGHVSQHDQRQLPYWELEIQFKLSNESYPRLYQAGILRHAEPAHATKGHHDTLIVGYAQKDVFQAHLLPDLLRQLEFN